MRRGEHSDGPLRPAAVRQRGRPSAISSWRTSTKPVRSWWAPSGRGIPRTSRPPPATAGPARRMAPASITCLHRGYPPRADPPPFRQPDARIAAGSTDRAVRVGPRRDAGHTLLPPPTGDTQRTRYVLLAMAELPPSVLRQTSSQPPVGPRMDGLVHLCPRLSSARRGGHRSRSAAGAGEAGREAGPCGAR